MTESNGPFLLAPDDAEDRIDDLIAILMDCVSGGSSIGFMEGLTEDECRTFWLSCIASAKQGHREIHGFEHDRTLVGTVQLITAMPPNQPHRAEISKMLVHREARRQGLGEKLLAFAEDRAREYQKTLLVLDTLTGTPAYRMYQKAGWHIVGEIPDYAALPDGPLRPTTIFYKSLA